MGVAEILAFVSGVFKFMPEVRKLIQVLQQSPQERVAKVVKLIDDEATKLRTTGRPEWQK